MKCHVLGEANATVFNMNNLAKISITENSRADDKEIYQ